MPRAILLALLFLLSWILYLDRAAISTAKDLVDKDLHLSNDAMGAVFGSFALASALGQIPAGWFADRYGPRLTLALVVAAWSLYGADRAGAGARDARGDPVSVRSGRGGGILAGTVLWLRMPYRERTT